MILSTEKYTKEKMQTGFGSNKYLLVNVSSLRARQINEGVEAYVRAKSLHPLEMAFQEIGEGYIDFELGTKAPVIEEEILDDEVLALDEMMSLESELDLEGEDEEFDIEAFGLEDEDDEEIDLDEVEVDEE